MNRELTADAIGSRERASATPGRTSANQAPSAKHASSAEQSAPKPGDAPAWAQQDTSLAAQQRWFLAVVTTPEDEEAPVDAESVARLVTPSQTLTALERLDIYRQGYHARLIDCLIDDYPVLQGALGEATFEALSRGYIARFPSVGPSLNVFGRHMAELCLSEPGRALLRGVESPLDPEFAASLASLEWAIVLAIHAETVEPISAEDLTRVPPERWPEARLAVNPSLQILRVTHPVNAYFSEQRRGGSPVVPQRADGAIAVYRTGRSVWRMALDAPGVTLVESLASGETLGASLERVAPLFADLSESDAAQSVTKLFRESVSSGMFSAVVLD